VTAARHGDRDAVRYIYARHADGVLEHVVDLLRDRCASRAITRTMFARLPVLLPSLPDGAPLLEWLLKVARGEAAERRRRR